MDPINPAIIAAVTSGVTSVGKEAIVDAYKGLFAQRKHRAHIR